MLLTVAIEAKSLGTKHLFTNLAFTIEPNEKAAIIGRNGVGKTTLLTMLTGQDADYDGEITFRRGTRVASTAQEHHHVGEQSALDYIIANLPDYARLHHIIQSYPNTMGDDVAKIETYSTALERFSALGYYQIEDAVLRSLSDYQITEAMARAPMTRLSGGQKRFVELVRIEHSDADLALIDEPTNHMDAVAKQAFIDWLKVVRHAVVVISHDRDVLQHVDKIIEIKDGRAQIFKGNYQAYLAQNATSAAAGMHDYEVAQRTLANLHKQIQAVRAKKASTRKTPNPFIPLERRLLKEYAALEATAAKPSFWIDRESAANLAKKTSDSYHKYKAKNIRIAADGNAGRQRELLRVEDLQLGYSGNPPLFAPLNFSLQRGERLRLAGRNGAGKTTLVRAIVAAAEGKRAETWRAGSIFTDSHLRLSVYEQEISPEMLGLTLHQAIEHVLLDANRPATQQDIMRLCGDYLFDPVRDGSLPVGNLSGGQKARLQIIRLLASEPNLLILDEPTNHLDLPSIEELEAALARYAGAVLYVSHDSYFARGMGGEMAELKANGG